MDLTRTIDRTLSRSTTRSFVDSIEFRVARDRNELEQAYGLVYREYLKRGYTKELSSAMRFSLFNALPSTTTFIAVNSGEILATASIIIDSRLGLPMDEIYKQELNTFRKDRLKICEASMLASNTELFKDGTSMMLQSKKMFLVFFLFRAILGYLRQVEKTDCICITINPKHNLIYDFLLFKNLGTLKTYSCANNAPAIAKYVDLNTVEKECLEQKKEGMKKMFFQEKIDSRLLSPRFNFSEDDLKYFFADKSDIFHTASPKQLAVIKAAYPQFDFSRIVT